MTCLSHKMHFRHTIPIQTQRSHSTEDLTGMGFDPNNNIPIPPVGKAALQQGAAVTNIYA